MNGRLVDPLIGRFLQADPFVQDPQDMRSDNRYGYCFNGPMNCTDPSGQIFKWLAHKWRDEVWRSPVGRAIVAVVVAYFTGGAAAAWMEGCACTASGAWAAGYAGVSGAAVGGFAAGAVSTGSLKGALQGAFSGAMFFGAGEMINGSGAFTSSGAVGDLGKYVEAVALHGVVGCVSSIASGGKCGPGMLSAAFSKAALPLTSAMGLKDGLGRAVGHAVIGGTASALGGGKFANGAVTGAFGYLFNELMHSAKEARAKYAGNSRGHHWVPFGATTGVDISSEARAAWGLATNGEVLPRDVHTFHPEYTSAVRAELTAFADARGIDLAKMTAAEANEFVQHVRTVDNPHIRPLVARVDGYMERISRFTGGQRIIYRAAVWMGLAATAEQMISVNTAACQANPDCR